MNHDNWEARVGNSAAKSWRSQPGLAWQPIHAGRMPNAVTKLAEERLKSERPPAKANQPSPDPASCASQAAS